MLQIRDYEKNDEKSIIDLFKKSFNKDLDYKEWKWDYDENICEGKYIKLMWDAEILAGHYAILPTKMKLYGDYYTTGLSMTTMTCPEYKKQGIFVKLAQTLYEENYNKIPIIYGFPNNNSLHGFVKYLGWSHVSDILMYSCHSYYVYSKDMDMNVKIVNELDERVDHLIKNIEPNYKIIVHRNKQYLHWRYKSNPKHKYYYMVYEEDNKYLGYCIYKIFEDENNKACDLVDIIAINNCIYEKLLMSLINLMNSKAIKNINAWFNNKDKLDIGKNIGFKATDVITHFGFKLNCDFINSEDIDLDNWYITMGDSDVF